MVGGWGEEGDMEWERIEGDWGGGVKVEIGGGGVLEMDDLGVSGVVGVEEEGEEGMVGWGSGGGMRVDGGNGMEGLGKI